MIPLEGKVDDMDVPEAMSQLIASKWQPSDQCLNTQSGFSAYSRYT